MKVEWWWSEKEILHEEHQKEVSSSVPVKYSITCQILPIAEDFVINLYETCSVKPNFVQL